MRSLKLPFLFVVALLTGCALFQLESPETWNERLTYTYAMESGAADAIETKADSGQLTREDANKLVDIVQNAKDVTDGARDAMLGGDATTAEGKLRLARNILNEINAYTGRQK